VTPVRYFTDEIGRAMGCPAQNKKSCARIVLRKEIEQGVHTDLQAPRYRVPAAAGRIGFQRRDLEILFDVDREMVEHSLARSARACENRMYSQWTHKLTPLMTTGL